MLTAIQSGWSWLAALPGLYTGAVSIAAIVALLMRLTDVLGPAPQYGLMLTLLGPVFTVTGLFNGIRRSVDAPNPG